MAMFREGTGFHAVDIDGDRTIAYGWDTTEDYSTRKYFSVRNRGTEIARMTGDGSWIGGTTQFDVRFYGAVGDGVTDDTAAFVAAVAAAAGAGGGVVFVPCSTAPYIVQPDQIELSSSVALIGGGSQFVGSNQGVGTTLKAASGSSGTCLIGASAVSQYDMAVRHLRLIGNSTVTNGILWDRCFNSFIEHVSVDQFQGAGIYLQLSTGSATNGNLRDIWAQNCVKATGLSGRVGAVTVEWSDCSMFNVNTTTSSTGVAESLNRVGILISGANNFLDQCVGQISEDGIVVSGARNRLVNCRADLNYGNGFVVSGGVNILTACLSISNSRAATNTYDGFVVGTGNFNTITGCNADSNIISEKHRHGFYNTTTSYGNWFSNCQSVAHATSLYATSTQVSFWQHRDRVVTMTADDTTPSVEDCKILNTVANTGATAITQLDNATMGQIVTVRCGNATNAPTITDGGNFQLSANWTPDLNDTITLLNVNGTVWTEIARSAN